MKNIVVIKATKLSELLPYSDSFQNSAVLLINEIVEFDQMDQSEISRLIVVNGCRYAVCFGLDCSTWDDSIDFAYLEENKFELSDENFVMTTWHNDETLEDIFCFFVNNTTFDSFIPSIYVVLLISNSDQLLEKIGKLAEEFGFASITANS